MSAELSLEGITGEEHWTNKGEVRLFMWEKYQGPPAQCKGTIVFVHGSSMASQPTFDLQVEGRPFCSAMDFFAAQGFDTWCVDSEGYGRSDKHRDIDSTISEGADDLEAASEYIQKTRAAGPLLVYGISSGALRAALFAQRHPERISRLALDAFVWTGQGSPTLEQRRKKLPEYLKTKRRPINEGFVRSIFTRDHAGTADDDVIEAYAKAITALDDSIPNGTYIDMCNHLPVIDPSKVLAPTIILRGEYDGIAGFDDLAAFFAALPNADKQFAVMPGLAHSSFQQKNFMIVYHILHSFFTQPEPIYRV